MSTTNTDWERVESELAAGHELMTRLRPLIREPLSDAVRLHLVEELSRVVSSFEVGISILQVLDSPGSAPSSSTKRSRVKKAKSGSDSTEHTNRREVISIRKCSDCIRIVSYAPYDDGYQWRKYGEKIIRNMVHTRTYYRCTHSGCSARKQVQQRGSGSPPQYDVTYNYDHTCGIPPAFPTPHLLQPPSSTSPSDSRIISFASNESSSMKLMNAACDRDMISPQRLTDRTCTTTATSSSVDPLLPDPGYSTQDLLMNTSDGAEGDIIGTCFSPEGPWFGGDALSYDWI